MILCLTQPQYVWFIFILMLSVAFVCKISLYVATSVTSTTISTRSTKFLFSQNTLYPFVCVCVCVCVLDPFLSITTTKNVCIFLILIKSHFLISIALRWCFSRALQFSLLTFEYFRGNSPKQRLTVFRLYVMWTSHIHTLLQLIGSYLCLKISFNQMWSLHFYVLIVCLLCLFSVCVCVCLM
jgi:hypothetical protein